MTKPTARPVTFADLKAMKPYEVTFDLTDADGTTIAFRLRAMGAARWRALLEQFPPTAEQVAEAAALGLDKPDFDGVLFPPEAIAATVVEPALTVEQVQELLDTWSGTEGLLLFTNAVRANTGTRILSKETART